MKVIITQEGYLNLDLFSSMNREESNEIIFSSSGTSSKMLFADETKRDLVFDRILVFVASGELSLDLR